MSNRKGRLLGVFSIVALLMGATMALAAELPPGGTFTDDDGSVHEGYIEALVEEGITTGCGEGLYCPNDPVTRGQMAAFLRRSLRDLPFIERVPFVAGDLSESVFASDILWTWRTGITNACGFANVDGHSAWLFCPEDEVTRGQMAAFLVRGFGYSDPGSTDFTDDNNSEFEVDIEKLATAGVTKGCNPPDNTQFCPDNSVTRAEMATFLGRALNLTPNVPPSTTTTAVEPPISTSSQPG